MSVWARIFDTANGQLLVTVEYDDADDTYGIRVRYDDPDGVSVSATPGGWPSRDRAVQAFNETDQQCAEDFAAALAGMCGKFAASKTGGDA